MLKILGGVLLPTSGINVPPHLRVLHISEQPLFFKGTLRDNLVFGVAPGDADGDTDRVLSICRRLLVPDTLIALIEAHAKDGQGTVVQWNDVLSLTQRVLLNLARALIANPEVLCIHRPTRAFERDMPQFDNTLKMLRCFVDEKGVEQNPKTFTFRRPRTCIITAGARAAGTDSFDAVLEIDGVRGVKEIRKKG